MIFKNQRTAFFSLRAVTIHANAHQDLIGCWNKVHKICSHSNFFIDGLNTTIRVAIRPPIVS